MSLGRLPTQIDPSQATTLLLSDVATTDLVKQDNFIDPIKHGHFLLALYPELLEATLKLIDEYSNKYVLGWLSAEFEGIKNDFFRVFSIDKQNEEELSQAFLILDTCQSSRVLTEKLRHRYDVLSTRILSLQRELTNFLVTMPSILDEAFQGKLLSKQESEQIRAYEIFWDARVLSKQGLLKSEDVFAFITQQLSELDFFKTVFHRKQHIESDEKSIKSEIITGMKKLEEQLAIESQIANKPEYQAYSLDDTLSLIEQAKALFQEYTSMTSSILHPWRRHGNMIEKIIQGLDAIQDKEDDEIAVVLKANLFIQRVKRIMFFSEQIVLNPNPTRVWFFQPTHSPDDQSSLWRRMNTAINKILQPRVPYELHDEAGVTPVFPSM